jgi:hypothetical protein
VGPSAAAQARARDRPFLRIDVVAETMSLDEFATIPSNKAIALVAPTVQRYLNGKLTGLDQ